MKISIDKSFERDSKRLPKDVQIQIKSVLTKLTEAQSLQELEVVKMHGASQAYRIRLGNYRIGFYLEGGCAVLSRILNRKEIYKYFPRK